MHETLKKAIAREAECSLALWDTDVYDTELVLTNHSDVIETVAYNKYKIEEVSDRDIDDIADMIDEKYILDEVKKEMEHDYGTQRFFDKER